MDASLEPDQLRAALEHQILAKAVAPVHLERDPAEIAEPLLSQAQKRSPFATQLARGWCRAPARRRRRSGLARANAVRELAVWSGAPEQTLNER